MKLLICHEFELRGADGSAKVWLQPLSAREEAVFNRKLRTALKADEAEGEDSNYTADDFLLRAVAARIDRVEVEGDGIPAPEGEDYEAWIDMMGGAVVGALSMTIRSKIEERHDLGKSSDGRG